MPKIKKKIKKINTPKKPIVSYKHMRKDRLNNPPVGFVPYNHIEPYNDLPLLPPSVEIENLEVLKKSAEAREALAVLKGRSVIIPNPKMLINTIVLQEASASSALENIITTNDKLFKAFSIANTALTDNATKEVLRYREALWQGYNQLINGNNLNKNLFVEIVKTITENNDGIRNSGPTNRVRIGNPIKREITYTPPEGIDIIENKIDNLSNFISETNDNIDPLVKLAVSHYQFEAIHPFFDGNGRTGRIVNSLFLVKRKLLDLPILYLSKYIIDNKSEYYNRLRGVTENSEWIPWILFIIEAIKITSRLTLDKVNSIKILLDDTIFKVKKDFPKIYSKELVEQLFYQPYCKISFLVDNNIAARNAAGRYLDTLFKAGILELQKVGRESLYLNKDLYDLLSH